MKKIFFFLATNFVYFSALFSQIYSDAIQSNYCVNDTFFSIQWGFYNSEFSGIDVSACEAWKYADGSGAKIAIIYYGIADINQLDLQDNIKEIRYFNNGIHYNENATRQAGIIAAKRNNFHEFAGLSNADLYLYYVNKMEDSPDAIEAALNRNVDIILFQLTSNFTGLTNYTEVVVALNNALQNGRNGKGCVVICPSGDAWDYQGKYVRFPGSDLGQIITVGGVGEEGFRVKVPITFYGDPINGRHSCYGEQLDMVAPGEKIFSTLPSAYNYNHNEIKYSFSEGTEYASSFVAGITALVLSVNPCLTVFEVEQVLKASCQKIHSQRSPSPFYPFAF